MSRKYSAKGDYGREEKSKEQKFLWLKDTKISQKSSCLVAFYTEEPNRS